MRENNAFLHEGSAAAQRQATPAQEAADPSARKTIFLVDDNLTNLTSGKNALAGDYNVFTFNSGERLLKMLERTRPDLILLDVEMPEMTGYDVIKIIKAKEETAAIPIVYLTAKSDTESELEGLSLGAVDYIVKPFSPQLLRKRIEVHLLIESQKRELHHYNTNLEYMVAEKTKTVVELKNAVLRTVAELVECRDDITGGHIERTQKYLSVLVEAMVDVGLYREEVAAWDVALVLQSAQLHDVGKIAISDSILKKPGKLTQEEFEEIKVHTTFGARIIEKIKKNTAEHEFLKYAKELAATHHERWDGKGYPKGLRGRDIPLSGRLMAIADVYDALVSVRPYKKAFSHEEAVAILSEGRGTQFDPALVDIFLTISDTFNEIANFHSQWPSDFLFGESY
ncbi:HD domain-containing phosphohydrolase [Desulfovibrio cuneatus]|uniref:HD domain-containing phosphohydrolase n=1 Tax=Desulfovibrio cuneatus TaxID=159728 RepID=UPI00040C1423|nr:HD domain-containing phosphohydrolase [Desulfovibrio cuneatus]